MSRIDAYLNALASAEPTPGGGSAATIVGALGAALCAMVARISAASPRLAALHEQAEALAAQADALRARLAAARPLDEAAYSLVVAASALPKADPEQKRARSAALQAALAGAAEAPLAAAALAAEGLGLAERVAELGNAHLASDVECALLFLRAALDASAANVRINHRFLHDAALVAAQAQRLAQLDGQAGEHEARAWAVLREQGPG